ncbi:hypothetical protein PV327_000547 [Microctonus hyperodae]|uniref:Copper homeostasis protein cutC homolog n=1 Tax=Microctonus hyperodae TaxID=165561 RepID=A0AA39G886_MICHY|nr:hypothetical protein PV327_000547 [Microctonus hyperodae]
MSNYHMEICIDSIESAKRAIAGGATRLEVCSALSEGGLTPSPGLCKFIKSHSKILVYAMIRIRHGNFVYTKDEVDAMLYDLLILRNIGVDGFVFGALNSDYTIDVNCCREIISAAKPLPVTFHRAFDEVKDPFQALQQIIDLGFVRILTSGQRNTALEGLNLISELIKLANDKIIIMPGSGITPENIEMIKKMSGAKEFHASAKVPVHTVRREILNEQNEIKMGSSERANLMMIASEDLIKQMINIINE